MTKVTIPNDMPVTPPHYSTLNAVTDNTLYRSLLRSKMLSYIYMYPRQLIFIWKSDCIGCGSVVGLTLLASFFLLPAALINMYYVYTSELLQLHTLWSHMTIT